MKAPATLSLLIFSLAASSISRAALTYVDVSGTNTSAPLAAPGTVWFAPAATQNGTDGLWGQRTSGPAAQAFGTSAYELYAAAADGGTATTNNIAVLQTTITGLTANATYTGLRIYYIGKTADGWPIQASVVSATTGFITYSAGGTQLETSTSNALGTVRATTITTDVRFFAALPDATADSSGNLNIYFTYSGSQRSVIDGFAYDNVAIPEPSTSAFSAAALAGLLLRRKRHA